MKDYSHNKVMTMIMWGAIVLITAGLVVAIIVGAVRAGKSGDPVGTVEPVDTAMDTTTQPEESDTDIPEIQTETKPTEKPSESPGISGDVSVDILEANKENEKDNRPHVVGDVSILPGIKEAEDETNN